MVSRTSQVSAEDVRASLWFFPSVAAAASVVVTMLALLVRPQASSTWGSVLWPGDVQSASTVLQVVATATMTATTLTFSLTVVALQLASQQFSPRLLREFARDRFTQAVLALLVSTFVVSLVGLRGMDPERPVPVLVAALSMVLGVLSAGGVLAFVGHIVRALRVDTMMVSVHAAAAVTIEQTYPPLHDESRAPARDLPGPDGGTLLTAVRSGFVRVVDPAVLVRAAREQGLFLRLGVRAGDHVVHGAPVCSVWRVGGSGDVRVDALQDAVVQAVELGFERTIEQDVALGLRQLTDIAVKAISPGINDPITAGHAVGYCADLLVRLLGKRLGEQEHLDEDGVPRLITPDRDLRYYLDLVCAPVRRFGRAEPLVLTALLRMLRDCAVAATVDGQREQIRRQVELVLEQMPPDLLPYDADAVRDLARRVELALAGDVDTAYRDRAGETRSV